MCQGSVRPPHLASPYLCNHGGTAKNSDAADEIHSGNKIKQSCMYVEQMYTNCLAEAAYWVESEGEAVVIDPIRETAPYIAKAEERGVTIKYIFETHFHADFVSGHIDLAKATGADIIYGPGADTK
jgi:glyoxylase-like metal-dependent hydrolase (beta-lactamase superfamily II)